MFMKTDKERELFIDNLRRKMVEATGFPYTSPDGLTVCPLTEVTNSFLTGALLYPEDARPEDIANYIKKRQKMFPDQWDRIDLDPEESAKKMFAAWKEATS